VGAVKIMPPYTSWKSPEIYTRLTDGTNNSLDSVNTMNAARLTINTYPDGWIHVYTDGSAFKATVNTGYGILIQYPDGTKDELHGPCGEECSNYEAELISIEIALHQLSTVFELFPSKIRNVVIFTDSKSALEALENNYGKKDLEQITTDVDKQIQSHAIELKMQWIPGHSNIPGNDRADKLAKMGSSQQQTS
jgi:ribonuclease HI